MSISDTTNPVVVAVDGSEAALRAVRWAAAEAHRFGRRLRIVHVYDWPLPTYDQAIADMSTVDQAVRDGAELVLRGAAATVAEAVPGLEPGTEALRGQPARVLQEVSAHAALLVLGSRGLGGFSGLLAGSVTVALAAHGHCPVAVIRGAEPDGEGPVVVGVDGSPVSEEAVAVAFAEAATRRCALVAVHTWADASFPAGSEAAGHHPELEWAALAEQAAASLSERLAGWQEKYPEVTVRRVVERDRPAPALLRAAAGAQLLVVGSRGRGGFTGLLLGSVSQAVLHHAPCPVLIARPNPA